MTEVVNQEQLDEDNEPILENTDTFPCPSCGANMHFDPNEQCLTCPYCSNKIEISQDSETIKEYDFNSAEELASKNWGNETRTIKCESCGAETVLEQDATAQFCAFCGSSHIVNADDDDRIAPESVVPFKIAKSKAGELFSKWIKKLWFAPNELKKNHDKDKLIGTYIPHWTYDSSTSSFYTADRGTHYYVTRTRKVNGKTQTVRERRTRWRRVQGVYAEDFDDVLVHASRNIDQSLISKLEPFHLNELVRYKPEYLSGFLAERYSVNLQEGWQCAQGDIDNDIRSGIRRQVGGDECRIRSVNTSYNDVKFKHILLPVWISSFKFKNKVYRFLVNGQTGEVQGHYPKSPLKIGLAVAVAILAAVGIYYVSQMQESLPLLKLLPLF